MSTRRQSTDASKLSFPLQVVILIVTVAGSVWASTYNLKSDVRDILTRMEYQQKLNEAQNANSNAKIADVRLQQEKLDTLVKDLQKQVADLKERIMTNQLQRSRP